MNFAVLLEGWGALGLAILALTIGPLLSYFVREKGKFFSFLDTFVLFSVGGFIFLHVLPHSWEEGGWWVLPAALLGLIIPELFGHLHGDKSSEKLKVGTSILAFIGLFLHTAIDGLALVKTGQSPGGTTLSMAVIVHRIPVGLMLWWMFAPLFGFWGTMAAFFLLAFSTGLGFFAGEYLFPTHNSFAFSLLQAFIAGTLLHVLFHPPVEVELKDGEKSPNRFSELMGGVFGLAIVLLFPLLDKSHHYASAEAFREHHYLREYWDRFFHLAAASAPALLLGYALAGILAVFLPQSSWGWLKRGKSWSQAVKGMLFGIPLPICSCGVVPLYRSLIQKGIPIAAGMAFLIATPELGVESLILSVPLLGWKLTLLRLLSAAAVAFSVGWLMGKLVDAGDSHRHGGEEEAESNHRPKTFGEKVRDSAKIGFVETLDDTVMWIVLGIAIAAFFQPEAMRPFLSQLPFGLDVVVLAVVGIPIYVCASGATPLAAAMILGGISPGGALAFLISGPATNTTTFGILSQLHGKKTALKFGISVILASIAMGIFTNLALGKFEVSSLPITDHKVSTLQLISLGLLSILFLLSLYRNGLRNSIKGILPSFLIDSGERRSEESEECNSCCSDSCELQK